MKMKIRNKEYNLIEKKQIFNTDKLDEFNTHLYYVERKNKLFIYSKTYDFYGCLNKTELERINER